MTPDERDDPVSRGPCEQRVWQPLRYPCTLLEIANRINELKPDERLDLLRQWSDESYKTGYKNGEARINEGNQTMIEAVQV